MPINPDWLRIAHKASGLLTAPDMGALLFTSYREVCVAVLQHTDTGRQAQFHARCHPPVQRLADDLPALLPEAVRPEIFAAMIRIIDQALSSLVRNPGQRRVIFAAAQHRIRQIQDTGLTLEGAVPWIPCLEEYPPYQGESIPEKTTYRTRA